MPHGKLGGDFLSAARGSRTISQAAARKLAVVLRHLPERYGFSSMERFLDALRASLRADEVYPDLGDICARKRYTKKTPALRQRFVALVAEGYTIAQLAAEFGMSRKAVSDLKRELGLSKPRQPKREAA